MSKVRIYAVCDEANDSYTMNIYVEKTADVRESLIETFEFTDRDTLESGIADTVEYMNKFNYDYEKYYMIC